MPLRASAAGADPNPSPTIGTGWVAEIWIDPDWYADQQSTDPLPSPGPAGRRPAAAPSILLGRASRSRGITPTSTSSDNGISRRHAQLTTDGTRWWVEDLGSSNGTYVGSSVGPLPTRSSPGPAPGDRRRRPHLPRRLDPPRRPHGLARRGLSPGGQESPVGRGFLNLSALARPDLFGNRPSSGAAGSVRSAAGLRGRAAWPVTDPRPLLAAERADTRAPAGRADRRLRRGGRRVARHQRRRRARPRGRHDRLRALAGGGAGPSGPRATSRRSTPPRPGCPPAPTASARPAASPSRPPGSRRAPPRAPASPAPPAPVETGPATYLLVAMRVEASEATITSTVVKRSSPSHCSRRVSTRP